MTEVAEHSLALLFALARNVAFFHHETKQGKYDLQTGPAMRRIEGQTLGIVGLGNIGKCLASKAMSLGMRVIATSRSQTTKMNGVEIVSLNGLLSQSDYISIHAPLTDQTRYMLAQSNLPK